MNPDQARLEKVLRQAMDAFQSGQWPRAEQLADEALGIAPRNYDAIQLKVLAMLNSGRAPEALPRAESMAALFPDDAFAHNSHGAVLQVLGRLDEAAGAYRKAVQLQPDNALAWTNLAQTCSALGRHDESAAACAKAVEYGARQPPVFLLLASALLSAGKASAALEPAREAARLAPDWPEAIELAARAELTVGSLSASLAHYERLEKLRPPADRWRFLRTLAWPPVVESRAQIAERMAEVDRALDDLISRPASIADPLREVCKTAFYMAYQGVDDTELQKKFARATLLATPGLAWASAHVDRPRDRSRRIRVGILSNHLRNHTIGRLNIGIAQKLDRKRFELTVIRPPCEPDFLSGAFDQCAERVITLRGELAEARRQVAEAELDVLFYPDIGMEASTYYLAFARLARVQFTTWGHPVTTGIPNMDFFVSTRGAEPPDGERFYSEKLVQFDKPPSYYYRPREPSAFDVRAHLGLKPGERLYASLQTLYKMHPDFDRALVEILRRDPQGRVLMIASAHEAWNARLKRRLSQEGEDVAGRIVLMPPVALPDYLATLRGVDALLDTFHFGGGNSSYESFGMSAPVVTLPGERMRARITAALYGRMGVSRWIARSVEEFVELGLTLAQGRDKRTAWREEIRAGADRFLENDAVIGEYERFIEAALA